MLNLEKHSITSRDYTVNYYQTLAKPPRILWLKIPKKKNQKLNKFNCKFYQKNAKICYIKMLNTIPWPIKKLLINYYQTLKAVFWPLGLEELE